MNVHGRHIMINCVGEGKEPLVSERGLCEFVAFRIGCDDTDQIVLLGREILMAIEAYEGGER